MNAALPYRDAQDPATRAWLERLDARLGEIPKTVRQRVGDGRRRRIVDWSPVETYRRIPVDAALEMLTL